MTDEIQNENPELTPDESAGTGPAATRVNDSILLGAGGTPAAPTTVRVVAKVGESCELGSGC